MRKRKAPEVIVDNSDDDTENKAAAPVESATTSLPRSAKTKLLNQPTWDKKKIKGSLLTKPDPKKAKVQDDLDDPAGQRHSTPNQGPVEYVNLSRPVLMPTYTHAARSRRYPGANVMAEANEQSKQALASRAQHVSRFVKRANTSTTSLASDLFNEEASVELNDAVDPYDLEELAEIEHDREAEDAESDNSDFANLDDSELSKQLKSEQGNWTTLGGAAIVPPSRSVSRTSMSSSGSMFNDNDNGPDDDEVEDIKPPANRCSEAVRFNVDESDAEIDDAYRKIKELKAAKLLKKKALKDAPTESASRPKINPMLPKTPGIRQQNHENERPVWAEPEPGRAFPAVKAETPVTPRVKIESNPASLIYPTWTSLVYDSADKSKLCLNTQDSRVKLVVQHSLIFLWASFLWIDAYPDVMSITEYMRKALFKAAKHLNDDDMTRRLSTDVIYNQELSTLLGGRISTWRVKSKTNAAAAIVTSYNISNDTPDRTAAWLKEMCYIYPGDVGDGIDHTLDGSRPYEHPMIISVLEQTFFSGLSSIGSRLPSKFKSSRTNRSEEKEVPIPMLALAATGVYASIKERETGPRVMADFGSNIFETTYRRHVDFLQSLLEQAPNKYHALMHRIYLKASTSKPSVPLKKAGFSSVFDISNMADE